MRGTYQYGTAIYPVSISDHFNSMAVLLLPSAARAQAMKEQGRISTMAALSFKCSCYMGILCIGIFTRFGKKLGTMIFAVNFPGLLSRSYAGYVLLCIWPLPWEAYRTVLENRNYIFTEHSSYGDSPGLCAFCSSRFWDPWIFMGISGQ